MPERKATDLETLGVSLGDARTSLDAQTAALEDAESSVETL